MRLQGKTVQITGGSSNELATARLIAPKELSVPADCSYSK
jgi:hypothetical protein